MQIETGYFVSNEEKKNDDEQRQVQLVELIYGKSSQSTSMLSFGW